MKAIFKKEFKAYFLSSIGYIFAGVFTLLCAMFFLGTAITYQVANINIVYLFLVSILTMRLFSEERNKKTDQLLLTAPVSVIEIVLGKYFAAMAVFGVTILISFVFPITLFAFGAPSVGEVLGSYIGVILLWGSFIAIGVLISATTESQMISAVFTFGILLIVYYMDWFIGNINNQYLVMALHWLSLFKRYNEFQSGILDVASVIYYLSFIFVILFLTVRTIEKRRYS